MRFKISCLVVFLTGIILAGMGASLTFVEWSSFSYGGKKTIEPKNANIETYSKTVDMSGLDMLNVYDHGYGYRYARVEIVESADAPPDSAVIEISYNSDIFEPYVRVDMFKDSGDSENFTDGEDDKWSNTENGEAGAEAEKHMPMLGEAYLSSRSYDDFAEIMLVKDDVMQNLREKKLYSYIVKTVYGVKIKVSPESMTKINIYSGY